MPRWTVYYHLLWWRTGRPVEGRGLESRAVDADDHLGALRAAELEILHDPLTKPHVWVPEVRSLVLQSPPRPRSPLPEITARYTVQCPICRESFTTEQLGPQTHSGCGEGVTINQCDVETYRDPAEFVKRRHFAHWNSAPERKEKAKIDDAATWINTHGRRVITTGYKACPGCRARVLNTNAACPHCAFVFTEVGGPCATPGRKPRTRSK